MKTKIRLWDAFMFAVMSVIGLAWLFMVLNGIILEDLIP